MKNPVCFPAIRSSLTCLLLAALTMPALAHASTEGALPLGASAPSPAASAARPVSLIRPRIETWPERIRVEGNVMPWQEVRISSDATGLRLTSVLAGVGESVQKGQVLALLDTAGVELELEAINAQLVEAEAAHAQADATLARARRLAASGGVSKQELTQYETQKQSAVARLAAAQSRVKTQQLKLASARLVAPDDGVISASFANEGDAVRAGAELFRLIRQGRLEWHAEVPGETLLRIEPGQEVLITSPLGDDVRARVRRLSPTIDLKTRLGIAYVELPAGTRFKAGLLVSGSFTTRSRALVLPASAIREDDSGAWVLTVSAEGRAKRLPVSLGRNQDGKLEITEGLDERSRVIEDARTLQPGDLVNSA